MKRYRMIDGATFSAATAEELIQKMREKSFTLSVDTEAFMQQTATRAMLQSSKHVRTDSAQHFVEDLIAAALLCVVDEDGDEVKRCEKCSQPIEVRAKFMQPVACPLCGCVQNPPEGNGKDDLTSV